MTIASNYRRGAHEHFEPGDDLDPHAQRRLRGHLEQIDYTAYAANREVVNAMLGATDAQKFQKLGVAAAQARARWVGAAIAATETGQPPGHDQIEKIARLRFAYEELTEVYDAMRRMVERGYITFTAPGA